MNMKPALHAAFQKELGSISGNTNLMQKRLQCKKRLGQVK